MNKESSAQCWTLYTDGSSCPASQKAAIGFVLYKSPGEEPVQQFGKSIPYATSHAAEFSAVIYGLKAAYQKGARTVELRSDLQTMVNQLNGNSKVNAAHLKSLHEEVGEQMKKFTAVTVVYIDRSQNALADGLARTALNSDKTLVQSSAKVAPETAPKVSGQTDPLATPSSNTPQQFWKPVGNELCVWNLETLWARAQSLLLETIPVAQLQPFLDMPGWFGDEPLTLRRIAELSYHTANADLDKPLLLCEDELLDGRFRLAKALCNGRQEITVKRLKQLPKPDARYPLRHAP